MTPLFVVLGLCALAGGGCKRLVSCEAAVGNIAALSGKIEKGQEVPSDAVAQCEKEWSPEERYCAVAAKDQATLATCFPRLTQRAQRPGAPRAPDGGH